MNHFEEKVSEMHDRMHPVPDDIELPGKYVEATAQELEYSGGFNWKTFGIVMGVVAAVAITCVAVYYLRPTMVSWQGEMVTQSEYKMIQNVESNIVKTLERMSF